MLVTIKLQRPSVISCAAVAAQPGSVQLHLPQLFQPGFLLFSLLMLSPRPKLSTSLGESTPIGGCDYFCCDQALLKKKKCCTASW